MKPQSLSSCIPPCYSYVVQLFSFKAKLYPARAAGNYTHCLYEGKTCSPITFIFQRLRLYIQPGWLVLIYGTVLCVLLGSCRPGEKKTGPVYGETSLTAKDTVYYFAVHPLYNPVKLTKVYQPLITYLNGHVKGARFILESSRDYASFEEKISSKTPDFLLPNPLHTIHAMSYGYEVIAMAGVKTDFKGIFIVRKDGGIRTPADLKGKVVSYPSPTALAACIMPQYYLHKNGININKDIRNLYVGSQESSIMNVYTKHSSAGATWPPPWRFFQKEHPQEAAELKVIWETPSLINNSVMVRTDVPAAVREQVRDCLLKLHEHEEGRDILRNMETKQFLNAVNSDYNIVKDYIHVFEQEVRIIDLK